MSGVKRGPSVLERTKQFEKIGETCGRDEDNEESENEEESMDFADLVRNITSESHAHGITTETDALQEAFKILDYDEDGFISVADLKKAMEMFDEDEDENDEKEKKGEEEEHEEEEDGELREMIAEADTDGDGKISFEDFLQVLSKPETETQPEEAPQKQKKESKKKKRQKQKA